MRIQKSLIAVAITLTTHQALAAGFQINAQSATGLGRAFAGDAVIADNASVMARNPAAMSLFDKTSMSLGFETITTMIDVNDAVYTNANGMTASADYDDAGDTSVAPNLHLIVPINNKVAVGVSAYSNFGTKTEFDDDYIASEYGGKTKILSLNIGIAASYRIDDQWSIGGGLDAIYGEGTLQRTLSDSIYTGPTDNPTGKFLNALNGAQALDIASASGWGFGFNVGTVYELNKNNRFGLSYHYSPEIEAKKGSKSVNIPLPDMAEFSGYHRLDNRPFAIHYSIQFIGWSTFDKITFKNASLNEKPYEWKDGWHYAIGGTYYLNETWTLRAGYMYDESAQDKLTSISVPDSDRQWFSTGVGYKINEKATIDFGFTYLLGKDVDVEENQVRSNTTLSTLTGTSHADAILMGFQYSRTF
jgi:long-chain fatty acid transport protein